MVPPDAGFDLSIREFGQVRWDPTAARNDRRVTGVTWHAALWRGTGTRRTASPASGATGQLIIVPSALARALASLMARIAAARARSFFTSAGDNPLGAAARPSSARPSRPNTIIRFRRCRASAPGEATTEREVSI